VDEESLHTYYEAADIFLMPSEYEGMPIALLEAFSYGVVPICSNIPELKKLVIDGYNGLLFESGDIKQLAKKMQKLAINHKLRDFLLKSGRKFVKYYDWNKIALKTKFLYEKVLEINQK